MCANSGFVTRVLAIILILAGSISSFGMPALLAQSQQAPRAVDAASRAQQRASEAIERAVAAQDRSTTATDRAVSAQSRAADATQRAADASFRGSERSGAALGQVPRNLANEAGTRDPRRARMGLSRKPLDLVGAYRDLVLAHGDALELRGEYAAVRGEVLALDADQPVIDAVARLGYKPSSRETIAGLGVDFTTLAIPPGKTVQAALTELRALDLGVEFAANDIMLQSGATEGIAGSQPLAPETPFTGPAIGLIDGGVGATAFVLRLMQKGFATGAPAADAHATALASLAAGRGRIASAAPGAPLYAADIYGTDPRGGNALAVARALGWMVQLDVPVVVIGVVGPDNPVLRRAVTSARAKGMIIVAPVGNAGAAARPLYPAAYDAVIGVTAVDRRNRALVEAGRGAHVHFAAPGAGIRAAVGGDLVREVRGTSFAAPLLAGLLWRLRHKRDPVAALEDEALDLGATGRDPVFGVGLVCAACR
jgi:minor extracellular protease Epr